MRKGKIYQILVISLVILGIVGLSWVSYRSAENNRKSEARYERLMYYYYPYLKEFADISDEYVRMKESQMYDYVRTGKGRYVYENVPYKDGGYFAMRSFVNIERTLEYGKMLRMMHRNPFYDYCPDSKVEEQWACLSLLENVQKMIEVDIFDTDVFEEEYRDRVCELLDSLSIEVKIGVRNLSKYKGGLKINLNDIPESVYDLDSY